MADIGVARPASPLISAVSYIQWGPVIAGALTAAALASVLHAFAGAIGLAVSSAAPTWRDASIALWLLSGVYLILVAVASYGLGGYVAGLLREHTAPLQSSTAISDNDADMRDGLHGLIVWALATLLTALLLLAAIPATARLAATSGGSAGPSTSVAGENLVAFDVDRLLRGDRRQGEDMGYIRAEATRILLTGSSHSGVAAEDRAYLVRLVSARTGLAAPEAERRVDATLGSARENIIRARRSTVILAFMAGAAALVGAAAAWYAAIAGGEQRDDRAPSQRWRVLVARTTIRR